MENIQETVEKVVKNINQVKTQFEKLEEIVNDISSCKSDYTKNILVSAISKISEQIGIKEKVFE